MPTNNKELLKLLKDMHVLRLGYSSSSDYVLRLAFDRIKELQAFRGKKELAPEILNQYESIIDKANDPVFLGAHLYALELIGVKDILFKAILITLDKKELRQEPMVSQLAGKIAASHLKIKLEHDKDFTEKELDDINITLRKEVRQ